MAELPVPKFTYQVFPDVPGPLEHLMELANNFWWVWNPEAVELFRRLDRELWEMVYHNPVKLLGTLQPGTVAVPHGWGHQHARGLGIASKLGGANVNLLAADGPEAVERVSGMAHLTGIRVRVEKAAGPIDPTSWSGMPQTADA